MTPRQADGASGVAGIAPAPSDELSWLSQRYAYVVPDTELLEVLRAHAPLLEIGAGTGYWAYRLGLMDTDVLAYDQAPPTSAGVNRYHPGAGTWTEVRQGGQEVLAANGDRTLFVCWPPLFSSLGDCLSHYSGEVVACITDGGHRTARLSGLEDDFDQITSHPARALDSAPGHPASLGIWRRRRPSDPPRPAPGRPPGQAPCLADRHNF